MDSVDLDVLKRGADWLDAGHRALLVTVVQTFGSSPRPEGAMLAVRDDGLVVGSVSGGCIEDDIVGRTRREGQKATKCEVVTYGVSADEARRFGLPCGGNVPAAHLINFVGARTEIFLFGVTQGEFVLARFHAL